MKSVALLLFRSHLRAIFAVAVTNIVLILVVYLTKNNTELTLSQLPWSETLLMICGAVIGILILGVSFYLGFLGKLERRGNWLSTLPIDRTTARAFAVLATLSFGALQLLLFFPILRFNFSVSGMPISFLTQFIPVALLLFTLQARRPWLGFLAGSVSLIFVFAIWSRNFGPWAQEQFRLTVESVGVIATLALTLAIVRFQIKWVAVCLVVLCLPHALLESFQAVRTPPQIATLLLDIGDYPAQYKIARLESYVSARLHDGGKIVPVIETFDFTKPDTRSLNKLILRANEFFSEKGIQSLVSYALRYPNALIAFDKYDKGKRDSNRYYYFHWSLLRDRLKTLNATVLADLKTGHEINPSHCSLLLPENDPLVIRTLISPACRQAPAWGDSGLLGGARNLKVSSAIIQTLSNEYEHAGEKRKDGMLTDPADTQWLQTTNARLLKAQGKFDTSPGKTETNGFRLLLKFTRQRVESALSLVKGKSYDQFIEQVRAPSLASPADVNEFLDKMTIFCNEVVDSCRSYVLPKELRTWDYRQAHRLFPIASDSRFDIFYALRSQLTDPRNRSRIEELARTQ